MLVCSGPTSALLCAREDGGRPLRTAFPRVLPTLCLVRFGQREALVRGGGRGQGRSRGSPLPCPGCPVPSRPPSEASLVSVFAGWPWLPGSENAPPSSWSLQTRVDVLSGAESPPHPAAPSLRILLIPLLSTLSCLSHCLGRSPDGGAGRWGLCGATLRPPTPAQRDQPRALRGPAWVPSSRGRGRRGPWAGGGPTGGGGPTSTAWTRRSAGPVQVCRAGGPGWREPGSH